ncbi:Fic family protein [Gulosibacter molinativorax]|uniref:Fic family protein n=1 Tax=Gulosibacter molinativorax TaxID=256821 RepID=UPI0004162276|nr:Fic family protein [Gulosibacter molinativorax]QUY63433.1 Cell division protein Fic [Gulosibacter molinativorax]
MSGDAVPVDDVVETMNSFELFDEMIDSLDAPISAERIKRYHGILKRGTAQSNLDWFVVGGWKRVPNVVGLQQTTAPEHVELAMSELLEQTPSRGAMSFADIVDFHHRFESIHPFQDGSGRVGRIVMFQQCLQNGIMPFIGLDAQKELYYRGLREYETQPGFLRETLRSFQDSYYAKFAELVPVVGREGP